MPPAPHGSISAPAARISFAQKIAQLGEAIQQAIGRGHAGFHLPVAMNDQIGIERDPVF